MTYEFLLYSIAMMMVCLCLIVMMVCAYLAGMANILEIKPKTKPKETDKQPAAMDEKAKKEAEKRQRNKALIDEAQEEMDKAVQDFISRGGLPK